MKNKCVENTYVTNLLESEEITRKIYKKAKSHLVYRNIFACVLSLVIGLSAWVILQTFVNTEFDGEICEWMTLILSIFGMIWILIVFSVFSIRITNAADDLALIKKRYLECRTSDELLLDKRAKKRRIVAQILCIIIIVLCPIIKTEIDNYKADEIYVKAETLIWNEQDYEGAKELLENIEIDYKDKEPLIVYCQAKIDYLNGNLEDAYLSQDDMIFGYQTEEHFNRIGAFKEVLDYEYQEYLDEKYPDKKEESVIPETTTRYHYKPSYTPNDDPYDIDRYRNEEDFYYDNYDNFIDYYEAEKYFKEHKK